MSRFIRCDRCPAESAVIGTVSLPPGWQTICHADLCERCCEIVRDFIRFRASDADRLPVEPIPLEVGPTDAPPDKLFETAPEELCATPADSNAVPGTDSRDVAATASILPAGTTMKRSTTTIPTTEMATIPSSPESEASTEERARTRRVKNRPPAPPPPQPGAPA